MKLAGGLLRSVRVESFFKAVGVAGYKHGGEYRVGGEAVTAHPRFDPDTGELPFSAEAAHRQGVVAWRL